MEISCKNISEELSQKHQTELNEMKRTLKSELEQVKEKMETLGLEKEQVESRYFNFGESCHLKKSHCESSNVEFNLFHLHVFDALSLSQ